MNLKNKTYQLSGNATNSPDTGNIAAVIVSRVLNACNLRERGLLHWWTDCGWTACMLWRIHADFFSPFLSDNYCTTLFLRKVRRARTRPRGEFMHITWWLATAKVGSVQWREAGGDSSPRHDFYLGSNPQLARRGPRVLRESTNQENASDAFRHRTANSLPMDLVWLNQLVSH